MGSPVNRKQAPKRIPGAALSLVLLAAAAHLPAHAIQLPPEATYAANQAIDDDTVRAVYFTEFIVQ